MEPASNEMTHCWGLIDERTGRERERFLCTLPMKAQQQREQLLLKSSRTQLSYEFEPQKHAKVWVGNKFRMSPLIESLFFHRCLQVACFDSPRVQKKESKLLGQSNKTCCAKVQSLELGQCSSELLSTCIINKAIKYRVQRSGNVFQNFYLYVQKQQANLLQSRAWLS